MLEAAYDAWATDILTGRTSVLVAATGADVAALNARARAERITAGHVDGDPADASTCGTGTAPSVGDWVVTRTNHAHADLEPRPRLGQERRHLDRHRPAPRRLPHRPARQPTARSSGTAPAARRLRRRHLSSSPTPPPPTACKAATVDTAHALVDPAMTREALYVASTRGRTRHALVRRHRAPPGRHQRPRTRPTAHRLEVLTAVLARTGAEDSATHTLRATDHEPRQLPSLVARYRHAWNRAALDSLQTPPTPLLAPHQASRLLADPGARPSPGLLPSPLDAEPIPRRCSRPPSTTTT